MEYERLTIEEIEDFTQRVCVQLCPELTRQLLSMAVELIEYKYKIEQGTLKEEKTCVYDEYNDGDWHYWECSNCGDAFCFSNEFTPEENHYYYCPNCGARITEYKELQE